jgi:hypothetical protein
MQEPMMQDDQIIKALRQRLPAILKLAFSTKGADKTVPGVFVRGHINDMVLEERAVPGMFSHDIWRPMADGEKERLLLLAFPDEDVYSEELLRQLEAQAIPTQ